MNAETYILLTVARKLSKAEKRDTCTEELLRENRRALAALLRE